MRTSDDVTILTISYFLNNKYKARCFRQSDETRSYKCLGINTGKLKLGRFALSPKFQTFRLEIKRTNNFVRSDQNICGQFWRWSSLIGLLILVTRIEMSLSFDKIVVPSTTILHFCLQEQQPNLHWLLSGLCSWNAPFHSASGIFLYPSYELFQCIGTVTNLFTLPRNRFQIGCWLQRYLRKNIQQTGWSVSKHGIIWKVL